MEPKRKSSVILPEPNIPGYEDCCITEVHLTTCSHIWFMNKFNPSCNVPQVLISKRFGTDSKEWSLQLDRSSSEQYIVDIIYHGSDNFKAEVKIGFLNAKQEIVYFNPNILVLFEPNKINDVLRYRFTKDDLLKGNCLTDNKLQIAAEIKFVSTLTCTVNERKKDFKQHPCTLTNDMGNCLTKHTHCDVTLVVNGRKCQAHKAMLAARSVVFADLIELHAKENNNNFITITDVDHAAFKEMLKFIYTGSAPNLKKMPIQLLKVADKFALDRLKAMCEVEIYRKLSEESAAETLIKADLYNAKQLKAKTVAFMKTETPIEDNFSLLPERIEIFEMGGSITQMQLKKDSYNWTIKNFSICSKFGLILRTPDCPNDIFIWYLCLNLEREDSYAIELRLSKLYATNNAAYATIYFLNARGDKVHVCNVPIEQNFSGMDFSIRHSFRAYDILNGNVLSGDDLKICCEMEICSNIRHYNFENTNEAIMAGFNMPECKLPDDLGNLLKTPRYADVKLVADNNHEFRAHKFILAARSSVFAAMFQPQKKGGTNIADCVPITSISHKTLKEILEFIYTGKATNLYEMPIELLAAAQEYALEKLKLMCQETLNIVPNTDADFYSVKQN